MGKAAENERRKLRATFYNNLSVAWAIGGLVGPYLALFNKDTRDALGPPSEWVGSHRVQALGYVMAGLVALFSVWFFRRKANLAAGEIED